MPNADTEEHFDSEFSLLRLDLQANGVLGTEDSRRLSGILRNGLTARVLAVVLYRLSRATGLRAPVLASVLKQLNQLVTGADVAWQASIGGGLVLYHPVGVVIGPGCKLGSECRIQQGVTIGGDGSPLGDLGRSPTIGSQVFFGAGSKVFGGVTVGDNTRIGANAVVLRDVPTGATAVGVPAKLLTGGVDQLESKR